MHLHSCPLLYKVPALRALFHNHPHRNPVKIVSMLPEKHTPSPKEPRLSRYMQAAPSMPITLPLTHSPS